MCDFIASHTLFIYHYICMLCWVKEGGERLLERGGFLGTYSGSDLQSALAEAT